MLFLSLNPRNTTCGIRIVTYGLCYFLSTKNWPRYAANRARALPASSVAPTSPETMLFALLAESAAAFHATARPGVCGRAGFAAMQQKGEAGGMRTRPLGGSDIMVSELGLGTQRWGGTDFNSPDEQTCHAMLDLATEAGVNLVDTAEQYPIPSGRGKNAEGATEAIIGSWMAKVG